jgi:hypothetical protein
VIQNRQAGYKKRDKTKKRASPEKQRKTKTKQRPPEAEELLRSAAEPEVF